MPASASLTLESIYTKLGLSSSPIFFQVYANFCNSPVADLTSIVKYFIRSEDPPLAFIVGYFIDEDDTSPNFLKA